MSEEERNYIEKIKNIKREVDGKCYNIISINDKKKLIHFKNKNIQFKDFLKDFLVDLEEEYGTISLFIPYKDNFYTIKKIEYGDRKILTPNLDYFVYKYNYIDINQDSIIQNEDDSINYLIMLKK